ncbi:hypothetical protein EW146_g5601 [Bondarzewia mesenterica]|uniref:F-box domain-containing protein n=1 Tax=Bondarzewia mesenterica TaxID=1095465 RepID=A0A4S4LWP9_9AGAM|nr:hypothetical protein EW146_g5601 [Bondarzewia mesenterica]
MPSIQTLSPEVLSEIFLHCVVTNEVTLPSCAPILLTRVTRLWRAVALSTPRLWSHLCLARSSVWTKPSKAHVHLPSDDVTKARSYVTALKTWLSLSKCTSLTLSFFVQEIAPTAGDEDMLAEYMRILCIHSARWKDVKIHILFNLLKIIMILNQCRSLPLLESFYFDNEDAISEPIDITILESASLLRRARITYPFLQSWFLPWSQLTCLSIKHCIGSSSDAMDEMKFFDVDLFIEILSHCINLEVLNVHCDFVVFPSVARSTSTFAILPQLQSFRMVISVDDEDEEDANEAEITLALLVQCLTHLVLPKLRTLVLTIRSIHHRWDDSFLQFLTHFSESLEHLEIIYCSLPLHMAKSMLERLSNLTSMMVILFDITSARDWEGILGGLTLTSTAYGSKQLVPALTQLQVSWLDHFFAYRKEGLETMSLFYESLATMIESRWQARSCRVLEVGEGTDAPSGLITLCLGHSEIAVEKMALLQCARIARCMEEGLHLVNSLRKPPSFRSCADDKTSMYPRW